MDVVKLCVLVRAKMRGFFVRRKFHNAMRQANEICFKHPTLKLRLSAAWTLLTIIFLRFIKLIINKKIK